MPTAKRSRTPARKAPSKEIAVVEKSVLEIEFDRIIKEMHESFDRTNAEMQAAMDDAIETLPSNDMWLDHIHAVFDHVEQQANDTIDRLEEESDNDTAMVDAEVDLTKALGALHEETHAVWSKTFEVGEGVARSVVTDSEPNGN